MQFCTNCGSQLAEGSNFCTVCGATAQAQGASFQQPQNNNYVPPQNTYVPPTYQAPQQPPYGVTPPAGKTPVPEANSTPDPNDVALNKTNAVLAYLGILVLVPLLSDKGKVSPFARFHVTQGLGLLIVNVIISVVSGVIRAFSDNLILLSLLSIISFGMLAIEIIGIVNAAKGTLKPLPLIGDFALNIFGKQ